MTLRSPLHVPIRAPDPAGIARRSQDGIHFSLPSAPGLVGATTYTFSGASIGPAGFFSAAIFLTPIAGNWSNGLTLTLGDGASGGTFNPTTLTPAGGTSTVQSFLYKPASLGSINITSNSAGAMTDPSAWLYFSQGTILLGQACL